MRKSLHALGMLCQTRRSMRLICSFLLLIFFSLSASAHVTEIRVNQAQDGSLTWYLSSYHGLGECGIANSGLTINGVNYPLESEHSGDVANLSSNVFATLAGYAHASYAVVHTPFLGTTLSVQPYSNNACWSFLVGGNGNFTPPPPPVCSTCPLTGWSSSFNLPGNNNGTACNPADDYTTGTIKVSHLACANITGDKQFSLVFDPGGANVAYGPFNYAAGVETNVTINVPSGSTTSTMVKVVDSDFPCEITHGLNGSYLGEKETVPPVFTTCVQNQNVSSCVTTLPNYLSGVSATDNCTAAGSLIITQSPIAGTPIAPGQTLEVKITAKDAAGNFTNCTFFVTRSSQLSTSISQSSVSCSGGNNGAISVVANGGAAPYSYSIDNGVNFVASGSFNSLTAGTYQVVVKDASGCSSTAQSITITQPGAINISAAGATTFCQGGNVKLSLPVTSNVIGFDDLPSSSTPIPNPYKGFIWTTDHNSLPMYYLRGTDAGGTGYANGVISPSNVAYNPYGYAQSEIKSVSGTFYFKGAYFTSAWSNQNITFNGYLNGSLVRTSQVYTINTITPSFIELNWSNIDKLEILSTGSQWAMDNFTIGTGEATPTGQWTLNGAPISGATAESYTATQGGVYQFVTSTGCSSNSIPVTVNALPSFTTAVVNVMCVGGNNGSITVNAAGATNDFQYSIDGGNTFQSSNVFSNLTIGNYNVVVKNASGCTSSKPVSVIKIPDTIRPGLTLPASITVTAPVGACSIAASNVNLGTATAQDNCSGVTVTNNAPAVYPVGVTVVIWTAKDAAGNITAGQQMVNVVSSNPPVLAATSAIAANNDAGACGATVTVATPAASNVCANSSECDTDNIDSYTNGQVSGQSPRWTPWPESGGSAVVTSALSFSGSKSVYVSNEQDQLYLLGDKTSGKWNLSWKMYVPAGKAGYFNTQHFQTAGIEWGQQVNFNTDGTGSLQADSALTPFTYPQGQWFDVKQTFDLDADQTTLSVNGVAIHTWKFSKQANNRLGAKQLGSIDFYAYPVGVSEYYIDDITFCGGNTPVVTGVRSDNQALTATYPVGNTTITWTATDGAGHTATSTQTVTVTDNEAPVLTCPVIAQPICYAGSGSYSIDPLVASDNCGIASTTYAVSGATTRSGSGSNASGSFNIGTSTITWTVTDIHGNSSNCTTTVVINAPVTGAIPDVYAVSPGGLVNTLYVGYGPGSVTLTAAGNGGTAPYTYHWSNGSNVASTVVSAAGTYTVTITDKYGCTTTVSKTINSIDVRCGNKNDKVLVCQKTGSAKNPWVQICIAPSAVATHLANGSTLGECAISAVTTREGVSKSAIVAEATIMAYPNPSRGVVNLRLSNYAAGKVTIQLLDGTGKAVLTEQTSISYKTEDVTLGLGRLAAGVYNVRISGEKGTQFTKVVVVR